MTTRTELLELIRNGENSLVEFKRDTVTNRDLAKELVALANLRGGRVLLGVDDDGAVPGVTREKLEEWVMTACRDKIRPEIIPVFELLRDVDPGRDVAVITIGPGYAVHHVWHDQHRTYYIRVGTLSREASPEELGRLFQRRGAMRSELQPVSGTSVVSLDPRRLDDYFGRVRHQPLPESAHDRECVLVNTELLDEGGAATVAGTVLFGRDVARVLPHAGISAAAYQGVEKDYATTERAALRGPLVALGSAAGVVEAGVVEQAIAFVSRNARSVSRLEGGRRVDTPAYPHEVVREVVVNAVVHRDYLLTSTDIELSLYADRLEVTSPGRLPNGVTVEGMRAGARAARNQLIKDVMRDYDYLEHMGMGVPRKIIAGMHAHNGTDPDFVVGEESLTVRLWYGAPEIYSKQ
jgi:ATP-dependent DNA helicase RecG